MKLIIIPTFSYQISIASNDVRVRPMIVRGICRNSIIITTVGSLRIRSQLNKLLSPIYCNSNGKRNKRIFPKQIVIYKNIYAQGNVSQSKKVAPHKLGKFFDTFYRTFIIRHYTSSNFHLKNITLISRNIIIKALKGAHFLLKVTFLNLLNPLGRKIYEY